jgi:hypothetical protein
MPKFAANLTMLFNELDFADRFAAAAGARTPQISLPNTATCQELFNACAARGGRAWDHSAMVRALEAPRRSRDRAARRLGRHARLSGRFRVGGAPLGDLLVTGPTLTNVNDFRAVLVTDGGQE